jgi:hypothetical protein
MHTKKSKNAAPQDVYSVDTSEWRPYAQGERTATTRNVHDDVDCVPESTTCACCAWTNTDRGRDALIAHYQCEWHIYNVKCRAKHKQPVSRRVFDSLTDGELRLPVCAHTRNMQTNRVSRYLMMTMTMTQWWPRNCRHTWVRSSCSHAMVICTECTEQC